MRSSNLKEQAAIPAEGVARTMVRKGLLSRTTDLKLFWHSERGVVWSLEGRMSAERCVVCLRSRCSSSA